MAGPIALVKKHPIAFTVGGLAVLGVGLLAFGGGGGGSADTNAYAAGGAESSVEAGVALQQIQSAAGVAAQKVEAQREVALATTAAQLEAAQLAANTAMYQTDAALEAAGLEFDYRGMVSTLEAETVGKEIEANLQRDIEQQGTIRHQADTMVELVEAQNKPRGLFSFLFG